MIPYCRHVMGEEEALAGAEALRSGWIARGPRVAKFEQKLAEKLEASHVVACSTGSAGIELALRALKIGPGDEVLVPSLTWAATATAVKLVGARPVFIDTEPGTHCISAQAAARFLTPRTRAVIAVDFAGLPCDREVWGRFARAHSLFFVVDAAHSMGARCADGRPVGADGTADLTVFSLHPAKTITTGEGGLVTTADGQWAARLKLLRGNGVLKGFPGSRGPWDLQVDEVGGNHHLTEVQAAIGLVQLERMDQLIADRGGVWARYSLAFGAESMPVELPEHPKGSALNLYVVLLPDSPNGQLRDAVARTMRQAEVGVHVHYPLLHRQPVFRGDQPPEDPLLPNSVRYERRALTLPLYPGLSIDDIQRVVKTLSHALQVHRKEPTLEGAAAEV